MAVPAGRPGTSTGASGRPTRSTPARPTSTSASGAPCTSARTPPTPRATARSRPRSHELGGHKSLYSEAFYDRETFDRLYDGANLAAVKRRYDPDDRLPSLYDKAVRDDDDLTLSKLSIAEALDSLLKEPLPLRFTAYDGSAAGPADSPYGIHLAQPSAGLNYILTAPGDLGFGARLRRGRPRDRRRAPGRPLRGVQAGPEQALVPPARARPRRSRMVRSLGISQPAPAAAAAAGGACPRWRRTFEGLRHSLGRDAEAIHHHYDVSNTLLRAGPRPVDDLHLRGLPDRGRDARGGAGREVRPGRPQARPPGRASGCSTSAAAGAAWSATRHASTACTRSASRSPASRRRGRSRRSRRRGSTTSPRCASWTTGTSRRPSFDAISSIGLTEHIGVKNYPAYFGFIRDRLRPQGRLLNHCITRPHNRLERDRRSSSTATSSRTAS